MGGRREGNSRRTESGSAGAGVCQSSRGKPGKPAKNRPASAEKEVTGTGCGKNQGFRGGKQGGSGGIFQNRTDRQIFQR